MQEDSTEAVGCNIGLLLKFPAQLMEKLET
jgi:hypothetical protein